MSKKKEIEYDQEEFPRITHESGLFQLVVFNDYFYIESRGRQGRVNIKATIDTLAQRFSGMRKPELIQFGEQIEVYKLQRGDASTVFHGSGRISSFAEIGHWDEMYTPQGFARLILGYLFEIDNKTLVDMGIRDFMEILPPDQAQGLLQRLSNRIIHVIPEEGMLENVPYLLSDGQIIYPDQK